MSTAGAASRLPADQTPDSDATAAAGIFPELLAGLVAGYSTADGDGRATSSDGAPPLDTPAGIETLLKGIRPPGKAVPAARPPARLAGSPEPSGTAPKRAARASHPEPDSAQLAAWQINFPIQLHPPLDIAMQANLPAESFLMPATVGGPAPTSSVPSPAASQAPDGQVPCAPGRTPAVLEAKLGLAGLGATADFQPNGQTAGAPKAAPIEAVAVGLPGLGATADFRPNGQTAGAPKAAPIEAVAVGSPGLSATVDFQPDGQTAGAPKAAPIEAVTGGLPGLGATADFQPNGQTAGAPKAAPIEAVAVGEPELPPRAASGGRPPNAPMAIPVATANPAGTEADGAPVSRLPAAPVAAQPGAKLPIKEEAAGGIKWERQPAIPVPAAQAAAQPGARPSMAVTGTPPAVPAPVAPAEELPRVQPQPVDPMPAEAPPSPVRQGTPPATRPRSGDPDGVVPAEGMTVRAGVSAPPPGVGPSDFSGRLAARLQPAAPPSRKPSSSVVAQVLALSGQVPWMVDSIPPAAPAPLPGPAFPPADRLPAGSRPAPQPPAPTVPVEAAPASPAESLIPGAGTQIRVLGSNTPDRDEVAFALQVRAMSTPVGAAPHASPAGPSAEGGERTPTPAQSGGAPVPDPAAASQKRASLPDEPEPTPARAGLERHSDTASLERPGPGAGATSGKMNPQASPNAQVRTETALERPQATEAPETKPVRPQDVHEVMDGAAKPEALKAPVVRDMKFEVSGGQQRVEVRLSERGGEVKMTVRTADEPLANTLREELPSLNARLAESGLRSEAWHPAASSTNELHTAESGARGAAHNTNQDADAQPRQQDREPPDGGAQRRSKSPQEAAPQKEKGKDLSWLMSSLR